jgi:hypothetical protein
MSDPVLCKICQERRARRFCPAVQGDICTLCCGTEREVSLSCPLECEYLREAHQHEKPVTINGNQLSNPDIIVDEEFIRDHEELLLFTVYALVQSAIRTAGAIDTDVIDALTTLIQTYRTLESGLFYESKPENLVAAAVQRAFTASLADYEKQRAERESLSPVRNSEVLAVLVFLHRIGQQNQNGRPRGRMFIDLLSQMTPPETGNNQRGSGIII